VDRHIAHSLSSTDALESTCSLSSTVPFSLGRLTTCVTAFNRSRASSRRSAGFLVGRTAGTGAMVFRRRLRMQNTQRKGQKTTTTNTGMRKANAVGVMPLWPTVFLQSLFCNARSCHCGSAGIATTFTLWYMSTEGDAITADVSDIRYIWYRQIKYAREV